MYLENEDDEIHSEMETDNVNNTAGDMFGDEEKENYVGGAGRKSVPNSDLINRSDYQVKINHENTILRLLN